jgi:hypothetical protein
VTLIQRRAPHVQPMRRASARLLRLAAAVLLSLGLVLAATGCGFQVQTNNPYTPADGVNFDVGSVKIRNLTIVSKTKGEGFFAGSLISPDPDELVSITGTATKPDGTEGPQFTADISTPVTVNNNKWVILTDRPSLITVKSPELEQGLTAKLLLTFRTAGEVTTFATVVDGNIPQYATISPSPSPSASS